MFAEILALTLASQAIAAQHEPVQENEIGNRAYSPPSAFSDEPPKEWMEWAEKCEPWDDWEKPAEAFPIAPGVYYVGTCGITALLVVTQGGLVLLDTGTETGAELVLRNVRLLDRDPARIEMILTSHEHFDHVGGVLVIQSESDAPVAAVAAAAAVLRTGEADPRDPQAGMHEPMAPARAVIEVPSDGKVSVGGVEFRAIATPGHTPGGTSWQWRACDAFGKCKTVVYADSLSPVSRDDYRFSDHPEYVAEYRAGLERLSRLDCDILLTPHPSASQMLKRAASGTFEGGTTCAEYATTVERRLEARLEREAGGDQ